MAFTVLDSINMRMLMSFGLEHIPDTPQNRHTFLSGLRDGWIEDGETGPETDECVAAINAELERLKPDCTCICGPDGGPIGDCRSLGCNPECPDCN